MIQLLPRAWRRKDASFSASTHMYPVPFYSLSLPRQPGRRALVRTAEVRLAVDARVLSPSRCPLLVPTGRLPRALSLCRAQPTCARPCLGAPPTWARAASCGSSVHATAHASREASGDGSAKLAVHPWTRLCVDVAVMWHADQPCLVCRLSEAASAITTSSVDATTSLPTSTTITYRIRTMNQPPSTPPPPYSPSLECPPPPGYTSSVATTFPPLSGNAPRVTFLGLAKSKFRRYVNKIVRKVFGV
ncbi:hypothetical protein B0H10DRAFT_2245442 [Mycena sp. CBHHK59/15]|nr:hypothetical protein B0H10DRAFT_2245442 [Mycena sp. CBHHK59/15]